MSRRRLPEQQIWCARMGIRGSSDFIEHDEFGFRNSTTLSEAKVLVVGDSFAYGPNVEPQQTWVARLQDAIGRKTYNASCCSWGPVQYMFAVEDLLPGMSPTTVVVGLFLGVDIFEAHRDVFGLRQHSLAAFRRGRRARAEPSEFARWRARSKALRALEVRYGLSRVQALLLGEAQGVVDCQRVVHHESTYWLTPNVRRAAMDLAEPAVKEGLELTKDCISSIAARVRGAGSDILVAVLPTKERIISVEMVGNQAGMPECDRMVACETRLEAELTAWFEHVGLPNVRLSQFLDAGCFEAGTDDAHLSVLGCNLVGNVVAKYLQPIPV